MILLKLFNLLKIEYKPSNAFFIGMFYAVLGIILAFFIFNDYAGIVSVFFISIAMIPPLNRLVELTAIKEGRIETIKEKGLEFKELRVRGKKLTLKGLWGDHKNLIQVYFYSFFGIFIVFSLLTLLSPQEISFELFGEQFVSTNPSAGKAINNCITKECLFEEIIQNNFKVLLVSFIISLIYGSGVIFIISWNASVWGVAFASQALNLASSAGQNPIVFFALIILTVLPHTITEALTYFTAAISGSISSHAIAREKWFELRFNQLLLQSLIILSIALLLLVIAAFLEVYVIDFFKWLFLGN
jgi:hypothetical protein